MLVITREYVKNGWYILSMGALQDPKMAWYVSIIFRAIFSEDILFHKPEKSALCWVPPIFIGAWPAWPLS